MRKDYTSDTKIDVWKCISKVKKTKKTKLIKETYFQKGIDKVHTVSKCQENDLRWTIY